jgi:hypothetical protein
MSEGSNAAGSSSLEPTAWVAMSLPVSESLAMSAPNSEPSATFAPLS